MGQNDKVKYSADSLIFKLSNPIPLNPGSVICRKQVSFAIVTAARVTFTFQTIF